MEFIYITIDSTATNFYTVTKLMHADCPHFESCVIWMNSYQELFIFFFFSFWPQQDLRDGSCIAILRSACALKVDLSEPRWIHICQSNRNTVYISTCVQKTEVINFISNLNVSRSVHQTKNREANHDGSISSDIRLFCMPTELYGSKWMISFVMLHS